MSGPNAGSVCGASEREMLDYIVAHAPGYPREAVINYYVALKAKRFVILAGPPEVNKVRLIEGLADALVGRPSVYWCSFQAHPWWATRTRAPGRFAAAHAQFNTLKLLDFIATASASEAMGFSLPFLVCVQRMSAAEVESYFHDLSRGLAWRADASVLQVDVPGNLYVTGTWDVEERQSLALSEEVRPYARVVWVNDSSATRSVEGSEVPRRRADWACEFATSAIHRAARAREKLGSILPDDSAPLAPLRDLEHFLEGVSLPPSLFEDTWLYLANAFDSRGGGLFTDAAIENLRIAQDYVLAQSVLPYLSDRSIGARWGWRTVGEHLALRFPRAWARIGDLEAWTSHHTRGGRRATVAAVDLGA